MSAHLIRASDGVALRVDATGPVTGPPLFLLHALGTNMAVWDGLLPLLPPGLRIVRMDLRGHGGSDAPSGAYAMGRLISDAEAVMDGLELRDAVILGLSIGGMIAQGLAVKRLDLVRGLILSNTAAKIGNATLWQERIAEVEAIGLATLAPAIADRWFGRRFKDRSRIEAMIRATPKAGYTGACAAIAGTDFYTPTSGLRLPTLGIAGADDRSTPPDLVRETVDLIPGSRFKLIRQAGHLPFIEDPEAYARAVTEFLKDIGHTG